MSDAWDPSLYDPTTRPADGLLLKAIGGRSGTIALENGQKLRFPWKAQQQVSGSAPPRIQSYEITGLQHTLGFQIAGAVMDTNSPTIDMQSPFPDDSGEPTLYINSGARVGSSSANILLTGDATTPTVAITGVLTLYDSLATDDITNRVGAMTIDSSSTLTLRSGNTMTLQPDANVNAQIVTTGTGDILLDSADGLTLDSANLTGLATADIAFTAGDDINLTAGGDLTLATTGGPINLNAGLNQNVVLSAAGTGRVEIGTAGTTLIGDSGGVVTIGGTTATINIGGYPFSGAWTAFTPTLSGTGTALGNGTLAGFYLRLGKLLIVRVRFTLGSTSTVGTTISFALPSGMTAVTQTDQFQMFPGMLRDTGTVENFGMFRVTSGATAITAYCLGVGGTYATVNAVSSTVPHTWANTDVMSFVGVMEVA